MQSAAVDQANAGYLIPNSYLVSVRLPFLCDPLDNSGALDYGVEHCNVFSFKKEEKHVVVGSTAEVKPFPVRNEHPRSGFFLEGTQ